MYDFWVQNSIVSKGSANSATPVPKMTFLKKNKDINDPHIRQEAKICTEFAQNTLKIFIKIQQEHNEFSFDVYIFQFETILLCKAKWKGKQSCFCIYCLNPPVILKSINGYWTSLKISLIMPYILISYQ